QIRGNHYADLVGLEFLVKSENIPGKAYNPQRLLMQDYFLKYYRPTTQITDSLLVLKAELVLENSFETAVEQTMSHTSGKYWLIAGAFGKMELAQKIAGELFDKGFDAQIIEKGNLFMVAIDIDNNQSNVNFRKQFIAATGIGDAWILKK
ncbi:MAG: SPOR domain-containing protein, partial [Chitinophagales bacterium]